MIQELWGLFPRLMEKNINSLLEKAEPNSTRSFQIYKTLKRDNLWQGNYQDFMRCIETYYSKPKTERKKSDFDCFLTNPMDNETYESFQLNFRNAHIPEQWLDDLASWAHNLIRVSKKIQSPVISTDAISKALKYLTNPSPFEKLENVEFQDFCSAWEKAVSKLYGLKHDPVFKELIEELLFIDSQLKETARNELLQIPPPLVYLSKNELDWVISVRQMATENRDIPRFSSSRGPQKLCLLELERVISLYRIVQITKDIDLLNHRDNIRVTVIDRCDRLLANQLKLRAA